MRIRDTEITFGDVAGALALVLLLVAGLWIGCGLGLSGETW